MSYYIDTKFLFAPTICKNLCCSSDSGRHINFREALVLTFSIEKCDQARAMSFLSLFLLSAREYRSQNQDTTNFLCIYPPPTEIIGRSLSKSLVREKLGEIRSVLIQIYGCPALRQPVTKMQSSYFAWILQELFGFRKLVMC